MTIFLLGATGLLGHNVLLQLLERRHNVVALVRNPGALRLPPAADRERLTLLKGSILDMGDLRSAADGCDAIVNCAGTTDMSLLRYSDYLPVNKMLCEYLLRLMDEKGIATLVHVSTANTIGYGTADRPTDESEPMMAPFSHSYYAQSKCEAEQMLQWAAQMNPDRHIVIVNPSFMIGAYDVKPSSGKLVEAAYGRRLMAVPRGGKCFVAVTAVAAAVANALQMGRNGEKYLLTGTSMPLSDFYRLQSSMAGYRQRLLLLPDWVVLLAGRVGDLLRFMGIAVQLSSRNVRQLLVHEYYDNSKAVRELQMPQTSVATALGDYLSWRSGK